MNKAVVTCAITGVLTNPSQHPVPVTPDEMAASAKEAFDAGASVMHALQNAGTRHGTFALLATGSRERNLRRNSVSMPGCDYQHEHGRYW